MNSRSIKIKTNAYAALNGLGSKRWILKRDTRLAALLALSCLPGTEALGNVSGAVDVIPTRVQQSAALDRQRLRAGNVRDR